MAKLILSMDGLVLKEIPLDKERTTIGRKPHNDIQIDNLAISGEHAVIITILNDSFLEDLGSTNGTFVNGQPVKKHFLQNNDVIELGKYRLKYVSRGVPQQDEPMKRRRDFEKTMILRPDASCRRTLPGRPTTSGMHGAHAFPWSMRRTRHGVPHTARRAPALPPSPHSGGIRTAAGAIQILSGRNAGKEMELTKTLTTLGKPGVQVAVIARRPHGYFITHVEGAHFRWSTARRSMPRRISLPIMT